MQEIAYNVKLDTASFDSSLQGLVSSLTKLQRHVSQVSRNINQIGGSANSAQTSLNGAASSMKSFTSSARDLTIIAGGVSLAIGGMKIAAESWVGSIIRVNAEMERLRFQLAGMSRAADPMKDAAEKVSDLRDMAKTAPFALSTLANSFVKLKASGIDPTNGSLQALVDGVAAFGGDDESFKRITLGISQMSGKGVIQMEELRQQLGESMPRAVELMARSMGVSMGELTKIISTGQLEAKKNLQGLFEEIERTYGGRALAMMQTFSGQVSQLKTNLQILATNEGGSGFFDQIKDLLVQLNDFLQTDRANAFATSLGQGLSTAVEYGMDFARTLYDMRDGLQSVALLAAALFGTNLLASGIASMSASIRSTAAAFGAVRADAGNVTTAVGLLASSFTATGQRSAALTMGLAGLANGIRLVGVALVTALPMIFAVGAGIMLIADYFDVFGTKAKTAFDDFAKFGADSIEEAKRVSDKHIGILEKEVASRKYILEQQQKNSYGVRNAGVITAEQLLENAEKNLKAGYGDRSTGNDRTADNVARIENQKLERELSERLNVYKNSYDQRMLVLGEQYTKEMDAAKDNGNSQREVHEQYTKDIANAQRDLLQSELTAIDALISETSGKLKKAGDQSIEGSAQLIKLHEKQIQGLNTKRQGVFSRMTSIDAANIKPSMLSGKSDDVEKQMDKGIKLVKTLTADYEELTAGIHGSSGAMAKLNYELSIGKYGNAKEGAEDFERLRQALIGATAAKDAFNTIDKGVKKLFGDIENAKKKALEEELELTQQLAGNYENLSDSQRISLRLNNGMYEGLGPNTDKLIAKLKEALAPITAQATAFANVGEVARDNAFGQATASAVDGTIAKVNQLSQTITDLRNNITGAGGDFSKMGQGFDPNFANNPDGNVNQVRQFSSSILELIASKESAGNYNATLDNGRWTGGDRNLVGMTLREVRALQDTMRTPENRALYGDGKGSSALGKYQIVGQTLESLIKKMGLSGNEKFDERMQDQMAMRLLNDRQGQGLKGLREEWQGLIKVPDEVILNALKSAGNGPTLARAAGFNPNGSAPTNAQPISQQATPAANSNIPQPLKFEDISKAIVSTVTQAQAEAKKALDEVKDLENGNDIKRAAVNDQKSITALNEIVEKLKLKEDGFSTARAQFYEKVRAGEIDPKNKDPNSAAYEKQRTILTEIERLEASRIKNKQLQSEYDEKSKQFAEQEKKLAEQLSELERKKANPNSIVDARSIQAARVATAEYLKITEERYTKDSAQYRAALATQQNVMRGHYQVQVAEIDIANQKEFEGFQRSQMSASQLREQERQDRLSKLKEQVELMRRAGATEVEIARYTAQQKAQINQQYSSSVGRAVSDVVTQWTDMETAVAGSIGGWMNSFADGIAGLITGTGDLRSAIQGIAKDLASMSIKWMMGSFMQKKGMGVATRHTGGTIGSSMGMNKTVSPLLFAGAPKFHTGGVVGQKLLPSEVPIIAKKGEVVLTPEQARVMGKRNGGGGAFSNFQISAPITVNGSSGTPEQNDDLAAKMAKQMEGTMRGVVADELRKQSRPGNTLNKRSR